MSGGSGDSMIFDMSQMTEGSPSVFVKRDWLNIQDQQNGNYGGNQLVIDTSQLANSNKYMAYREAYLSIPLVLAASCPITLVTGYGAAPAKTTENTVKGATVFDVDIPMSAEFIGATVTVAGATFPGGAKVASISPDGLKFSTTVASTTATTAGAAVQTTTSAQSDTFLKDLVKSSNSATNGVAQTYAIGLKSWFGSIVHSMTLDYAGTTIIQQTPWQSMWTSFGLMTTMGLSDLELNAATIGFYPDGSNTWSFQQSASSSGQGVCNNINAGILHSQAGTATGASAGNSGMLQRQVKTLVNPDTVAGGSTGSTTAATYGVIQPAAAMDQLWRSRLYSVYRDASNAGILYQIQAQIMLKHLHPFFSQVPLLKGVFFRLTLNLNQPEVYIKKTATTSLLSIESIVSPLGGIVPIIISSMAESTSTSLQSSPLNPADLPSEVVLQPAGVNGYTREAQNDQYMRVTLNVGNTVISQTQKNAFGGSASTGLDRSCFLYVPAYTFNPSFEEAYLSRPTKSIVYTDIYQFTTADVSKDAQFNFLLTNGISNIKSVLILPFFKNILTTGEMGATESVTYPPYQSPFDPAGTGPVSPLIALRNFNVVVAGQNMIYNTQQYNFEQFLNQLVGVNSVNANLTDGLTSGLVDFMSWQQSYGYYYVNCARMLPIDEAVPKSVNIQGTNMSKGTIQFLCFIEYGVQVSVDVLTGARV